MAEIGLNKIDSVKRGKIFAIGDIHGCISSLRKLFARLPYIKGRDTLVFMGDYIDRGPDSREVIEFIKNLQDSGHDLIPLMGNHEYYLIKAAAINNITDNDIFITSLRDIGIEATIESYGAKGLSLISGLSFMPLSHREFLNGLMPFWESDEFIFVHGGFNPELRLEEQSIPHIYEMRDIFLTSDFDFGKRVVFGHTPFETPLVTSTKIGIDTGAVYGNFLTAVELPELHFYHA